MRRSASQWSLKLVPLVLLLLVFSAGCQQHTASVRQDAMAHFEQGTGLHKVVVPGATREYYGKIYRGYKILMHGEAPHVWGRYGARVAMGELSREAGGIISYLGGGMEWSHGAAGSPFDRLLSLSLGQPLNIVLLLKHGKKKVPRLDIVVSSSSLQPEQVLSERGDLGFGNGSLYSDDPDFAEKLLADKKLTSRLSKLRHYYIRVDGLAVSFLWAGQEIDFSAMIRDHEDYNAMINSIIDSLADIADAIPAS